MTPSKISSSGVYVGLVGLQAAVMAPEICKGIILLNISLRMLHIKKQPWFGKPLIRSLQSLLRYKFDQ
jgi:pimeloyl-ACP methyl ester carboxylesterase